MTSTPKRREHRGGQRLANGSQAALANGQAPCSDNPLAMSNINGNNSSSRTRIRKEKRKRQRAREARMAAEQASAVGAGTSPENLLGIGGTLEGLPQTALFQHVGKISHDVKLTLAASRQRWPVAKEMAEAVLHSAGTKALEEHATISQKVMVVKMFAELDARNQSEEHHQDRMEYLEKARQDRARVGEYRPVNIGIKTEDSERVVVYIPDNHRDPPYSEEAESQMNGAD